MVLTMRIGGTKMCIRDRILPSEKAFAYKMKLDAMKRQQGERTDLTCATAVSYTHLDVYKRQELPSVFQQQLYTPLIRKFFKCFQKEKQ